MSRDWRPVDQYSCDKLFTLNGETLRDMEIKWVIKGETEVFLPNKQAKADYPELTFLFGGFNTLYKQNENNQEAKKTFNMFEEALKKAEANFERAKELSTGFPLDKELYKFDESQFMKQPIEIVVEEWFYGRLDSNFYYNEINNKMFYDFIVEKMTENKK